MISLGLDTAALVIVAALWGGMLFFAGLYAPLVFIKLEPDVAGRFIRQVFPAYYFTMGLTSGAAAIALLIGDRSRGAEVVLLLVVCAGFWFARQILMPRINHARDLKLAGNEVEGHRFERLHRLSVAINGAQLVAALFVLARFVWV